MPSIHREVLLTPDGQRHEFELKSDEWLSHMFRPDTGEWFAIIMRGKQPGPMYDLHTADYCRCGCLAQRCASPDRGDAA